MVKILRREGTGADAVRNAGGGRRRLAEEHHLQALHAHHQTSAVVLAGQPSYLLINIRRSFNHYASTKGDRVDSLICLFWLRFLCEFIY